MYLGVVEVGSWVEVFFCRYLFVTMSTSSARALRLLVKANGACPSGAERCVSNASGPHSRSTFDPLRDRLLSRYLERTPSAVLAIEMLSSRGARWVYNDHIAMRSFVDGHNASGLTWLRTTFSHFGFVPQPQIVIPGMPVTKK